jgi:alginate O-acetyltransferase complex protein AlgI
LLFNSIDFALFCPIIFLFYWFTTNKNLKLQNLLVVVASYIFYGWWDWRFLSLIAFSTILDFTVGRLLSKEDNNTKRKILLWISIFVNLGLLGFFKYYNFFLDNFITAFTLFGSDIKANSLKIILPVGVSFYTFQTMSYTIDIFRRKLDPTRDPIAFAAFVSFFPQLVAGPIERATHLLPQFYKIRIFDYSTAVDGMRQILWGLFKKIVIADNCAQYANLIFNNSSEYSGSTLVLGALFFTFQIYGDFSGYSDIAIGTSKLFGIDLMQNFKFPYFSRDIAEFWRRWHISLSTWFRDYLYIPLGGSHGETLSKVRNTFIIFIASGFWHGANWTFIFWGMLNAIYILPLLLSNRNRSNLDVVAQNKYLPGRKEFLSMITTFSLTVFAWIFFRAESLKHAFNYVDQIFSFSLFEIPKFSGRGGALTTIIFIAIFIIIEWQGRHGKYAIENIVNIRSKHLRIACYYALTFIIISFGNFNKNTFIYFQF